MLMPCFNPRASVATDISSNQIPKTLISTEKSMVVETSDMEIETSEYRLSCELRGHEDDVRSICVCGDLGIASSSRDRTVKLWNPDPQKKHRFVLSKSLVGHSSFVGPLAWIPPNDRFVEGAIVSGGMDTMVLLWDVSKGVIAETMRGHQQQVTGIVVDDNGDIISSSIDWYFP